MTLIKAGVVGLCFAVLVYGWLALSHRDDRGTVVFGEIIYDVRVAKTDFQKARGLSGTQQLGLREGLLFVGTKDESLGIWMKDMNYAIDIIWLEADGTVVAVRENARPEDFPEVYKPPRLARYVLEVAAGQTRQHGITSGDQAVIRLP